ncbi:hypothetical protein FRC19_007010 [Serendipita sp. 401]|nr:hypothetical protein FRC19_007010 [Serendipita sp. 401]
MAETVRIFCSVYAQDKDFSPFLVSIKRIDSIGELKVVIYDTEKLRFERLGYSVSKLKLYKAEIPTAELEDGIDTKLQQALEGPFLRVSQRVGDHLPANLTDEQVYIIAVVDGVEPPYKERRIDNDAGQSSAADIGISCESPYRPLPPFLTHSSQPSLSWNYLRRQSLMITNDPNHLYNIIIFRDYIYPGSMTI